MYDNLAASLQEDKFAKKALQLLGTAAQDGTLDTLTASLTPAPDRNKDKFLFDLVRPCLQNDLTGWTLCLHACQVHVPLLCT